MISHPEQLLRLFERREPLLLQVADIVVDARKSPADIVNELTLQLSSP